MLEREIQDKPTVDKRLPYLRRADLIVLSQTARYHDAGDHGVTDTGQVLYGLLRGPRSHRILLHGPDTVLAQETGSREAPLDIGHLLVLAHVVDEQPIAMGDLRARICGSKPTLVSRLDALDRRALIEKHPKFNAGGNGHPNHIAATTVGENVIDRMG